MEETDDRFYLAFSTIPGAGMGVFTRCNLKEGDRIEIIGVQIRNRAVSDRCTAFANSHKFKVNENLLLIPTGYAGMVNHSNFPNMKVEKFEGRMFLIAIKGILKGEELFHKYRDSYRWGTN